MTDKPTTGKMLTEWEDACQKRWIGFNPQESTLPQLLAYIRTLEAEHREMRQEWESFAATAEGKGKKGLSAKARSILSSIPQR